MQIEKGKNGIRRLIIGRYRKIKNPALKPASPFDRIENVSYVLYVAAMDSVGRGKLVNTFVSGGNYPGKRGRALAKPRMDRKQKACFRGKSMRGKLLFALIIFFAGFFTAIYITAPGEGRAGEQTMYSRETTRQIVDGRQEQIVKAQVFAKKVGTGMQQFLCLAGEKASELTEIIKNKVNETKQN